MFDFLDTIIAILIKVMSSTINYIDISVDIWFHRHYYCNII